MSTSLLALIANSITTYSDIDPEWKQFISDYKTYLISQSTLRTISNGYFQSVQYNMQAYLRSINYNVSCAWIIAMINNIPNDVYFAPGITMLYVPSFSIIEQLYTNYITSKQNNVT